jgi:RimJ/RimL family protein N-acetyltransferase
VEEKATGAFIGRIGLLYQEDWPEGRHKTEVGWLLDRSYWAQGLATEGALASLRYGFEELGLERIISIRPANLASRRVAQKAGLTCRWRGCGVVWYAIDCQDWEAGS